MPSFPTVNTAEVVQKARDAYDRDPTPATMAKILGSMIKATAELRAIAETVTLDLEESPWLKTWARDYDYLVDRLDEYRLAIGALTGVYSVSDVASAHGASVSQVPIIFTEHVVEPILFGNATTRIETPQLASQRPYSIVRFPDVSAPVRLANQLNVLDIWSFNAAGKVRRLAMETMNWVDESTGDVVDAWVQRKVDELSDLAKEKASEAIPGLVDEAKGMIRGEATKGAMIPVLIGGLMLLSLVRK
jgi:hypothetical protein